MSASQQKKTKGSDRFAGLNARQKAELEAQLKAKKEKRTVTIVCVVLVLLIAFLIGINSNLLYRNATAVTCGDVKYSVADFSFYYKSAYNNYVEQYSSFLQYMGLDTSKPLRSQTYPGSDDGTTWADYFKTQAMSNMASDTMLYTRAMEAGFTLSEEDQATLDSNLTAYESIYVGTGFDSADAYIAAALGKGLNLERVSELITRNYIASKYGESVNESYEYTEEELLANYEENKDDYDTYSFLLSQVSGAAPEDGSIDSETAMAEAKEKADQIAAKDTGSDDTDDSDDDDEDAEDPGVTSFKQKALALNGTDATQSRTQGKDLSSVYGEWLKDSARKSGDTTVIEDGTNYYVLYFIERDNNDYKTPQVRHILIRVEADAEDTYTDEAKDAALEEAEKILAEWKDGDATEDSFAVLANTYSEDGGSNTNGGYYDNFAKGSMVASFDEWVYDSSRKSGDTGIVYNEGSYVGYHIIYFVGYGDTYRNYLSDADLRSEDYEEWGLEQMESFEAAKGWAAFLVK